MHICDSSDNSPALSAVIEQLSKLRISGLLIFYSGSGEWVWANVQMIDGSSRYVECTTGNSIESTSEDGGQRKAPIRRRLPQD